MRLRLLVGAALVVLLLLAGGAYTFFRLVILPPASEVAEVKVDAQPAAGAETGAAPAGSAEGPSAVMGPPAPPATSPDARAAPKASAAPDITLLNPKPMQNDQTKLVAPKDGSVTTVPPMTPASGGTFAPAQPGATAGGATTGGGTGTPPDQTGSGGLAQPQGPGINAADLPPLPPPGGVATPDAGAAPGAGGAIDLMNGGGDGATGGQLAPSDRLVPPQLLPGAQIPVTGGTGDALLNGQTATPDSGTSGSGGNSSGNGSGSGPIDLLPAQ
jgi:hypothetical protein